MKINDYVVGSGAVAASFVAFCAVLYIRARAQAAASKHGRGTVLGSEEVGPSVSAGQAILPRNGYRKYRVQTKTGRAVDILSYSSFPNGSEPFLVFDARRGEYRFLRDVYLPATLAALGFVAALAILVCFAYGPFR